MLRTLASLLTTLGVFFALVGLRQAQRQRLRQFEAFFVKRYWDLIDGLSLSVIREEATERVAENDERIIRLYFRLCEDQLELRKDGWISDATWQLWAEGMAAQLASRPFSLVWSDVAKTSLARLPPNLTLLRRFVASEGRFDPSELPWWKAVTRGLRGGAG